MQRPQTNLMAEKDEAPHEADLGELFAELELSGPHSKDEKIAPLCDVRAM